MSRDRNFSFPSYINRYYDDPAFHKIVDAMYEMIHSGEFSAGHLREAVELAENKEIMYGKRVMPTATVEPMPGEKPKPTIEELGDAFQKASNEATRLNLQWKRAANDGLDLESHFLENAYLAAKKVRKKAFLAYTAALDTKPDLAELKAASGRSSGFATNIYANGISSIIHMFSNAKSISITDITEPNSASSALKLFKVIGEWSGKPADD